MQKPRCFRNMQEPEEKVEPTPTCALCFDSAPDAVLMECGHGGICFRCGIKLLKMKGNCPLCREVVSIVLRIDLGNVHGDFVKILDFIDLPQVTRPVIHM